MTRSSSASAALVKLDDPGIARWSAADLVALGQIVLGTVIVWTLPERRWEWLTGAIVRARMRCQPGWADEQKAHLLKFLERCDLPAPLEAILESYFANRRLSKLQALRCRHPGGWHPRIGLEGREHVEGALAAGRGAILWVAPFVFGPLVTKMAFHQAGFAVSHLSRYSHGYSQSRLGARLLNPVRTGVEARFLAERIVIGPEGSVHAPMRALADRLKANRLVSVSVGARGTKAISIPFMNGSIVLATGVPSLVQRSGAALLPVFTVREGDGGYVARVEAPLQPAPGLEREQATVDIMIRFARSLEAQVRRQPDQFWWHYDIIRAALPTYGDRNSRRDPVATA
jgi:lauroyl/myristoyl acyltransferase